MCLSQDVKQNLQIFEYLQDYQKDYSGSRSNIWIFKVYVPTTIMPLNGSSIPVAFLSKTAVTMPAPLKVVES